MFARDVAICLKPDCLKNFVSAFGNEVRTCTSQASGFRDGIPLGSEGSRNLDAISLWETKEQADAYELATYPGIVQDLGRFFEVPPKFRVMSVMSSMQVTSTTAA